MNKRRMIIISVAALVICLIAVIYFVTPHVAETAISNASVSSTPIAPMTEHTSTTAIESTVSTGQERSFVNPGGCCNTSSEPTK